MKAARSESAATLAMALDRTSDGLLLADRDGTIAYVNQPLRDLFGYDGNDLVGQPVEVLMPGHLRKAHRGHVAGYAAAPQPRSMGREDLDIEGRRLDGSTFPIDVQLAVVPDSGHVVATVRDMTAQRALAAEWALDKIDLARARDEVAQLHGSLDLVIQQLFGLGMAMSAGASNSTLIEDRLEKTTQRIDELIETVQIARRPVGPVANLTSGR